MKWRCLIVDDEPIARKLLKEYVQKIPDAEVLADCGTALDAMKYVQSGKVDILFLDIQMPDLTGLDFLKIIPEKPATILTTAYSEYAVQSYDLDVVDYLLKPIEFDRFYKAISKAMGLTATPPKVEAAVEKSSAEEVTNLFVKTDHKIIKIDLKDIVLVNGQGAYVQIITVDNQKIMSLQSMSKIESSLPDNFCRTHRSHIVNINHIDSIDGNRIFLKEHVAVLSKNKREEFLQLIDQLNLLRD